MQTINVFNWLIIGNSNNLAVLSCYFTGMSMQQVEDCSCTISLTLGFSVDRCVLCTPGLVLENW